MPLYGIQNLGGKPEGDFWGSWAAFQDFLQENPGLKQTISAAAIISGVAGLTHKIDSGFKDVLSRIADANVGSPLAAEYGRKDIKSVKTRDLVNKYKNKAAKL